MTAASNSGSEPPDTAAAGPLGPHNRARVDARLCDVHAARGRAAADPELAGRSSVRRIVLHLDSVLEPEQVCWGVLYVLEDGRPVAEDVRLGGVITVLDVASWLDDAGGDDEQAESGLAVLPDD